jgi:hypothetical protein
VYLEWRRQPLGGRMLLLRCWRCQRPCRALYGFKVGNDGRFYKAVMADWECRRCAELRYSSEGGYLRPGVVFRAFGSLPRRDCGFPRCSPTQTMLSGGSDKRPHSWPAIRSRHFQAFVNALSAGRGLNAKNQKPITFRPAKMANRLTVPTSNNPTYC